MGLFSLLVDEGENDSLAVVFLVLLIHTGDEILYIRQGLLFSHGSACFLFLNF
jgi:hypothetical protein